MEISNIIGAEFKKNVYDKDHEIGYFTTDLFLEKKLIVKLKALDTIVDPHLAQVLDYLKTIDNHLGLILNIGNPKLEMKRVINDG